MVGHAVLNYGSPVLVARSDCCAVGGGDGMMLARTGAVGRTRPGTRSSRSVVSDRASNRVEVGAIAPAWALRLFPVPTVRCGLEE